MGLELGCGWHVGEESVCVCMCTQLLGGRVWEEGKVNEAEESCW